MARYRNCRAQQGATEPAAKAVATQYRAPTAGLEDKVFTIGSTLDAAKFETVKEELGKHFATQSWSDGADAAAAFENLTETMYEEPMEPDVPKKRIGEEENPDYDVELLRYKMRITQYTTAHGEWTKSLKN